MKKHYILICLFSINFSFAQSVTSNTSLSLDEMLESITTNLDCTSISNISSPNNAQLNAQGFSSYASFDIQNEPNFPFENGIVLSTADATDLQNIISSGDGQWSGDADLEALIQEPGNTYNATVVEFDFVPFRNQLSVDYVLVSQEYPAFVCNYADTFAFIVSGPGISNTNLYDHDANPNTPEVSLDLGGLNIATLPGTTIPVNPTNVHDLSANCGSGSLGEIALPQFYDAQFSGNNILDFEGQTIPLTAEVDLVPGQTYHIKLVIADRGDTILNSAVFIDADSFVIGTIPEELPYEPGLPVSLPECWNTSDSANFEVSNDCSPGAQNHLKLYGGTYSITTAAVDAEGLNGIDISFDLLNGCDDAAEAGENLIVEYFDGSNWQLLDEINPVNLPSSFSGQTNNWQTFSYTITNGLSKNLMLKFIRFNGENQQDDINLANLSFENSTLSVNEFNFDNIVIYPNPAKDIIHFKGINNANSIELFDLRGKMIKKIDLYDNDEISIDINNLSAGIYLAKVFNNQSSVVRKIIKD